MGQDGNHERTESIIVIRFISIVLQKICRSGIPIPLLGSMFWKIARFLRIRFAIYGGSRRLQTTYDRNIRVWVSLSDHIESQIYWQGVQAADRGEVELLKSIFRSNQVFFDVGANIGVFTLLAAKRLTQGSVHAFEPSQVHLQKLHENLNLNPYRNIVVNSFGLSDTSCRKTLYIPRDTIPLRNTGMATFFAEQSHNYIKEQVQVKSLDQYIAERAIPDVDIIKIDVEGSELDVLTGAVTTLSRYKPAVVMEVSRTHLAAAGRSVEELFDFWRRMHYVLYRIDTHGGLRLIERVASFNDNQNIFCRPHDAGRDH